MGKFKEMDIDQKNFEKEREYTTQQELADEENKRKFRTEAKENRETLAYKMGKKAEKLRKW